MKLSLQPVSKHNWLDKIETDTTKQQQEFVTLAAEAIAASKFYLHYLNRGVYLGDKAIGFIQYYPNYQQQKPNEIFIDQLLVDVEQQDKGYGTKATELVLEEIKGLAGINSVSICYVGGDDVMQRFFQRFGFVVVELDEFDQTFMGLHY